MNGKPDARLLTVASLVPEGAILADVGTDHAFLPIYLLEQGKIPSAVASDLRDGPCERAKLHIAQHGLSDKITVRKTDGLHGLAAFSPTAITICGMGGELIASILDAAPWVKSPAISLILQPMTKADTLRRYLASHGFLPDAERLAAEADASKIYQIFRAHYTGVPYSLSPAQALLGDTQQLGTSPLFSPFVQRQIALLNIRIDGLHAAGRDAHEEEATRAVLKGWL